MNNYPLLDIRLGEVKNKISPCESYADIGSDHAYLPIRLIKEGTVNKAYITDINKGPLENSLRNAEKFRVTEHCKFLLGGGLKILDDIKIEVISICGMGSETIISMLRESEDIAREARLVLQPMTQPELLRRFLRENAYAITDESIVKDGHLFYQIICASACSQKAFHGKAENYEYEFSPLLIARKDAVMHEFLRYNLDKQIKIYNKIKDVSAELRNCVTEKIDYINEKLVEYEAE